MTLHPYRTPADVPAPEGPRLKPFWRREGVVELLFVVIVVGFVGTGAGFVHRSSNARAAERKAACGEYCDRLIADVPASCHSYCTSGDGSR